MYTTYNRYKEWGSFIVVTAVRVVVTWFAWNQVASYFGFRHITLLLAFGFVMAVNTLIDIVDRVRR